MLALPHPSFLCSRVVEYLSVQLGVEDFFSEVVRFGVGTFGVGAVQLVMGYIFVTTMNYAAEGQVREGISMAHGRIDGFCESVFIWCFMV